MKQRLSVCVSVLVALGMLSLLSTSCSAQKEQPQTPAASVPAAVPASNHTALNDIARYISGIAPKSDSMLLARAQEPSFRKYVAIADSNWKKFSITKAAKMQAWADKEIKDIDSATQTLFYPFSGPDFLYANIFFPNARKMVLMGLEPVGRVPDPRKIAADSMKLFFNSLDKSIEEAISLSFFRTNDMKIELKTRYVEGTVPVLLIFIARAGYDVLNVKPVAIDSLGMCEVGNADMLAGHDTASASGRGVEISYKLPAENEARTLWYFSCDLSNSGLNKLTHFARYVETLPSGVTTYLKSASYLMHKEYFSRIRKSVLNKSAFILQDDSAIPYKFFKKSVWNIQLFGSYEAPIKMFEMHQEQELKDAYATTAVRKLGFHIGYAAVSNQLVARKKPGAETAGEVRKPAK